MSPNYSRQVRNRDEFGFFDTSPGVGRRWLCRTNRFLQNMVHVRSRRKKPCKGSSAAGQPHHQTLKRMHHDTVTKPDRRSCDIEGQKVPHTCIAPYDLRITITIMHKSMPASADLNRKCTDAVYQVQYSVTTEQYLYRLLAILIGSLLWVRLLSGSDISRYST